MGFGGDRFGEVDFGVRRENVAEVVEVHCEVVGECYRESIWKKKERGGDLDDQVSDMSSIYKKGMGGEVGKV